MDCHPGNTGSSSEVGVRAHVPLGCWKSLTLEPGGGFVDVAEEGSISFLTVGLWVLLWLLLVILLRSAAWFPFSLGFFSYQ